MNIPSLLVLFLFLGAPSFDTKPLETSDDSKVTSNQFPNGIAWYGTWEAAKSEAERTGKPILLLSAAPQCHGVPGIW
ncbi:MAG: hypothetical protein GWP41_05860 [Planctomycetia bacterium]|jgi:hypothetical protein|nr:hypothetical protein [Planctomycetia bacterium]NCF98162.1 hypothetical protein [Planctomycetia bacterium]NCG12010.1 hypothetical protein [Planctomycetia bacterium]